MYQLSGDQLARVLNRPLSDENESARIDAMEAAIEQTLPVIEGLSQAITATARQAVFSRTIEQQLKMFVQINGSPFGEKVQCVPCKIREGYQERALVYVTA